MTRTPDASDILTLTNAIRAEAKAAGSAAVEAADVASWPSGGGRYDGKVSHGTTDPTGDLASDTARAAIRAELRRGEIELRKLLAKLKDVTSGIQRAVISTGIRKPDSAQQFTDADIEKHAAAWELKHGRYRGVGFDARGRRAEREIGVDR